MVVVRGVDLGIKEWKIKFNWNDPHCLLHAHWSFNCIPIELKMYCISNFQPCPMLSTWDIHIKSLGWQCYRWEVCMSMIEKNHHGTNQSEMHQIWEIHSSHNCPFQSKGQFQLFNNGNTIILFQYKMAPPHLTLSPPV